MAQPEHTPPPQAPHAHTEWCLKEPLPTCSQPAPCRSQESGCREGLQSPPQAGLCPPGCCHPAHLLPRNRRPYSWWSPGCGKWPDEPARHPGLWVHRSPQGPVKAPPPPAIGSRGSQWLSAPQRHVLAACLQPPGGGRGWASQPRPSQGWGQGDSDAIDNFLARARATWDPAPAGSPVSPALQGLWRWLPPHAQSAVGSPWHPSTQRLT